MLFATVPSLQDTTEGRENHALSGPAGNNGEIRGELAATKGSWSVTDLSWDRSEHRFIQWTFVERTEVLPSGSYTQFVPGLGTDKVANEDGTEMHKAGNADRRMAGKLRFYSP